MNEMNDISRMDGVEIKKTCCGICNQYSHCGIIKTAFSTR